MYNSIQKLNNEQNSMYYLNNSLIYRSHIKNVCFIVCDAVMI